MVKIGGGLTRAPAPAPAPAPSPSPIPREKREPAAPRAPVKPKLPAHVRDAFDLLYRSNQQRYERSRSHGMLFALDTVKAYLDELK